MQKIKVYYYYMCDKVYVCIHTLHEIYTFLHAYIYVLEVTEQLTCMSTHAVLATIF